MRVGKLKTYNIMANYYCEYCGQSFSSVAALTIGSCAFHPNGMYKGKHKLYEGGEKSSYCCKYCGQQFSSLKALTMGACGRHPNGMYKGKHAPAL